MVRARVSHSVFLSLSLFALAAAVTGCGDRDEASSAAPAPSAPAVELRGDGASFAYPLYGRWFKDYVDAHPNIRVDYQPAGSGGGVTQFSNRSVDFGASDAAMTDEEIARVDGGVQMIPVTAGSIVLAFHLAEVKALKLPRQVYVDIFLGKITMWNDPAILAANPGVSFPKMAIGVVHRADSSGTTLVFTRHLSAISPEWETGPGTSLAPAWPTGIGAKGNEGVSATIKQTVGSIGYVEYGYAKRSRLTMAALENKAGNTVEPTTASGQAALASANLPEDLRLVLPDPEGKDAYPIVTCAWLLAYRRYDRPGVAAALKAFVKYSLDAGQKVSEEMGYIPLPPSVVAANLKGLDNVK